ncbi:SEC-C metal-binding domain-containing protein [Hyalangium rubrum]|uniref:Antitoxin Xre/MbcA/ParS toxin-binding domain-containing protein n=1 Tax=Hyalangium rubrum TaxID=3103134 RepID=A0ABU5HET1_9BACT|nr:antitoxin Xre/MbcA/ParS toxin-binding domain-containing protein [Hyalangium sp. s54d21]MDY7231312.1 antitoxin Xre/MbcA/ParS toxin-binding domain-containing protein [Hyalangium sp. s54d21]
MSAHWRNAPCPCGSGKKAKHCCGSRADPSVDAPGAWLHGMDERLVGEMVAFGHQRFGREWLTEPTEAYFPLRRFEREDFQLFMPWVVNHWRVEGRPMREWFLEERGDRLREVERGWLQAQAAAVVTLWEVRQVREGEGVGVKDLLGGEERFVHEVRGSRMVQLRDVMLGRVVDYEGLSVFCGMHPNTLPPRAAHEVERTARRALRVRSGGVPHRKLAGDGVALGLIHLWMTEVLELELQPPPTLVNTDGELLLLTADDFTFSAKVRTRVLEALLSLEGAELNQEGVPADISFLKSGNAMHASWDNTLVGSARVAEASLRLETNSVERADALRARVEAACAGLLTHRKREHCDPEALMEAQGEEVSEYEAPEPEMLAALREFKAEHYAAWLDNPLPALKGKTPREAVRTAAGRREVELILKEFEHGEALLPEEERADILALRGELGLTE